MIDYEAKRERVIKEQRAELEGHYVDVMAALSGVQWRRRSWFEWWQGERVDERTLADVVLELLSRKSGQPDYEAIAGMRDAVLAYDRLSWRERWARTFSGRSVEKQRAVVLGCQAMHYRRHAKDTRTMKYYMWQSEGLSPDSGSKRDVVDPSPFNIRTSEWRFGEQVGRLSSWVYGSMSSAFTSLWGFMEKGSSELIQALRDKEESAANKKAREAKQARENAKDLQKIQEMVRALDLPYTQDLVALLKPYEQAALEGRPDLGAFVGECVRVVKILPERIRQHQEQVQQEFARKAVEDLNLIRDTLIGYMRKRGLSGGPSIKAALSSDTCPVRGTMESKGEEADDLSAEHVIE